MAIGRFRLFDHTLMRAREAVRTVPHHAANTVARTHKKLSSAATQCLDRTTRTLPTKHRAHYALLQTQAWLKHITKDIGNLAAVQPHERQELASILDRLGTVQEWVDQAEREIRG